MRITIQWKIIFAFLIISLTSIVIVSLVSMSQARSGLREDVAAHFSEMAQNQYIYVSQVMKDGHNDSLLLAENAVVKSDVPREAKQAELQQKRDILNEYEDITLIDPAGEVIASTGGGAAVDWESRDEFKQSMAGKPSVSGAHEVYDPHRTVITFTAPVIGSSGSVTSVIALQLNLEQIWNVIDQVRVGETGYAYVIDEQGYYIAFPDKKRVLQRADPEVLSEIAAGADLLEYEDKARNEVIGAYYQGGGAEQDAGTIYPAWNVVVVQEKEEAMMLLSRMQNRITFFSILGFLAVILIGLLFSRSLTRPIRQLTDGAESIGKGDFDYRVEVKSKDEIGRLGDTFNIMGEAISGDIAARQKAVHALKESEELYRCLVETSPDAIVLTDLEANVLVANQSAAATFRYASPEQMVGENFFEHVLVEDRERLYRLYRKAPVGDVNKNIELKMWRRDGTIIPVELSASLVLDSDKQPRGFIGLVRDITERRTVEEALRTSEEKYRAVFEATGTAMCTLDAEGVISFANQEFAGITGLSRQALEGGRRLADMVLKEDREAFEQNLEQALRGPAQVPLRFPMHMRKRTGEEMFALGNMARVPGTDNVVISLVDITRERIYERTLEERTKQLRDFLSIASHELRHPITLIKGYLELLAEELGEEEPSESVLLSLRRVQTSTDRLTLLGDELMDASRIEQGSFLLMKTRLNFEELVEHAVREMEMRDIDITFEARLSGDRREIEADREKVYRLLVILLENAAKFSPPRGLVEVEVEDKGGEKVVSVFDRGIGVPDNERLKIFDRFYQVEDVLHHSIGMGLGLYIATEIVETHGGRIWCNPRPGGGSIFGFSIPYLGA